MQGAKPFVRLTSSLASAAPPRLLGVEGLAALLANSPFNRQCHQGNLACATTPAGIHTVARKMPAAEPHSARRRSMRLAGVSTVGLSSSSATVTAGAAGSSPGAGQPASSKAVKGRRRAAGGGGTAALQEQEPVQTVRVTAGGRRPREAAEPASGADASGAAAAEKPKAPAGAAAKKARSGSAASAGPTRALEEALWAKSFRHVAGVDEAGRGPLAGPVVTAACVLPPGVQLEGVDDSKAMTEEQRERAYELLTSHPGVAWSTCIVGPAEIDERNILQATLHGMREAVKKLPADRLSYVLVDGNKLPAELPVPAQAVVRGDAKCLNIAAASIIAKVTRDRIMVEYDKLYPQYGFAQHKGYPTPGHFAAVRKHGPCPIYRRSFEPIRSMTGWSRQPKPSGS